MVAILVTTLVITVFCLGLQEFCVRKQLFGRGKWNMLLCSAVIWISASWVLLPDWGGKLCPGKADILSFVGERAAGRGLCLPMSHWTYLAVMLAGFIMGEIVYSGGRHAVVVFVKRRSNMGGGSEEGAGS